MNLIESDFIDFLKRLGYSSRYINVCIGSLKHFALHNGYNTMCDIADDVFMLLDRGKHTETKYDDKILLEVKRYAAALTLLNSFLFDVNYPRKFIFPNYSGRNIMQMLVTDQKYIPGVQPRTLKDTEGKKYFNIQDVIEALHVNEKTLQRWADAGVKPYRYKGIPPEFENDKAELDKYNRDVFTYYYYKLDELNEFLRYQFEYGTPRKKVIYMSDEDIRKK